MEMEGKEGSHVVVVAKLMMAEGEKVGGWGEGKVETEVEGRGGHM